MSILMDAGCGEADKSFGPVVRPSCRAFDFTLHFEHVTLSIIPAVALLLAATFRLWQLRRTPALAFRRYQIPKQAALFSYAITLIVNLHFWVVSSRRTSAAVASAALAVVVSLVLSALSYLEGVRSVRPSAVLNLYLFGSTLFDVVQVRTLWLANLQNLAIVSSVALGIKTVLLVLEALPKTPSLHDEKDAGVSREERAGIYSQRSFWWINRILWLGRRQTLKFANLDHIDAGLKTARYSSDLAHNWDAKDTGKYSLLLAVFTTLKWPLLAPAIPRLILIGFNFAQPFLIKRAIEHVEQGSGPSATDNIGYGLIGATVLVYSGLAIFNGYYGHLLYRSIVLVRGALVDIICSKSLDTELSVAQKAAPAGLVTADVERIDATVEKLHSIWASVVELAIGAYLLSREVGWAFVAPVVVAILCTGANTGINKLLPSRQKIWNQHIQKRVALTSKLLSNMKTAKMMGLSRYIADTLQKARIAELEASAGFRRCMAIVNTIVLVPRQISAPFTLTLFVLAVQNGTLTASRAFTALSLIEIITTPLTLLLQALTSITTSLACLDRIQEYLRSPDKLGPCAAPGSVVEVSSPALGSPELGYEMSEKLPLVFSTPDVAVCFKTASIYYDVSKPENRVLDFIHWTVPQGSTTIIVGPPGSGKSSLLKAILGEVNVEGEVYVRPGPIAYCDQSPWVPNESVRKCIVGKSDAPFDSAWYDEVVYACALAEEGDLGSIVHDSEKTVGSRGMALSEGQKQRLALARAVYSRAPLLLLDDIFRSLDLQTENLVHERVLSPANGLLKRHGMTAIFATHSVRHLGFADQVVALEDGELKQIGHPRTLGGGLVDDPDLVAQQLGLTVEPEPLLVPPKTSEEIAKPAAKAAPQKQTTPRKTIAAPGQVARVVGTRKRSTYRFYLGPVGLLQVIVLLTAVILLAFSTRFQRVWVGWWTEAAASLQAMYIGVYFLLAVGACLSFGFFFWWMFIVVVPVTAGSLHEQLLRSVLGAPFSYFTKVDSGVILNRFSQDMAMINGMLPVAVFQATSSGMMVLSQIATISYSSGYMAISVPVTLVALGILARFYLLTSQQLRILDIELKAPIYSSLTETKEGLVTIRAFGWQAAYKAQCQDRIDESKRAIYMLFMVQRWLNFVLDLVVAGLATVLMTIATQLRTSISPAALGVGLSSILGFSLITSQFIVAYTELENSLGAVARIEDCVDNIPSEDAGIQNATTRVLEPPRDWARNGEIHFSHVTAFYDDHEKPALSDISFRVLPGQKVLICGRTGSGKSTLLSALLRLADLQSDESQILIDGINIATLPAEKVRSVCAVIAQVPVLLPGSVRLNLEVSSGDTHSDEAMIATLTKVGLWEIVSERGGLGADMAAVALSHGQQQLFCLATAILKKGKASIVLMDEATSGVDDETERRMYQLIRDEFRDCTVIAIAHRLELAAEVCDLAVVLSGGESVEMGHPKALADAKGEFWRLLRM